MAWQRSYIFLFLLTFIGVSSEMSQDKLSESENKLSKMLEKFDDFLSNHEAGKTGDEKVEREVPSDCPTSDSALQVKSNSDVSRGKSSLDVLGNLIHMCGATTLMEDVPVGWEIIEGPGNQKINVTKYKKLSRGVPLCCHGYVRNDDDICVPKCKGKCHNGVCVSPGKCECYKGYTLNSVGNCVVTCPCGCPHGQCSGGQCICDPGYDLDETGRVCNPVCNPGCVYADCVSPDTCACHHGYQKDPHNNHQCTANCHNGCDNGDCTGPDVCVCHGGYYKRDSTSQCVPQCHGCEHGDCVQPFTCHCHHGYQRINDKCEPICEGGCINATCTAPEHCTCSQGYEKQHGLSSKICSPRCFPRCIHGSCVSPGHCQCHPGYYKKDRHHCKAIVSTVAGVVGSILNS